MLFHFFYFSGLERCSEFSSQADLLHSPCLWHRSADCCSEQQINKYFKSYVLFGQQKLSNKASCFLYVLEKREWQALLVTNIIGASIVWFDTKTKRLVFFLVWLLFLRRFIKLCNYNLNNKWVPICFLHNFIYSSVILALTCGDVEMDSHWFIQENPQKN